MKEKVLRASYDKIICTQKTEETNVSNEGLRKVQGLHNVTKIVKKEDVRYFKNRMTLLQTVIPRKRNDRGNSQCSARVIRRECFCCGRGSNKFQFRKSRLGGGPIETT